MKKEIFFDKLKIFIGLEIHITVNSEKKIFNLSKNYKEKISPNKNIGKWELGYLGVLPIINFQVIEKALKLANSLNMKINETIIFDRKIYNYPDLSKGYQITQKEKVFATSGYFDVIDEEKKITVPIKSIHLEEDTAKIIYSKDEIFLDFNRSGNPLIELVTDPIFSDIKKLINFIKQLRTLLIYLDISDSKMEMGQIRIDINYSLIIDNIYFTPRYEIKNLNSLNNIEICLEEEIKKHYIFFSQNLSPPISQTMKFDEKKKKTFFSREKKEYYFIPEINIPPIKLKKKQIKNCKKKLPIIPSILWKKIIKKTKINNINKLINNVDLIKLISIIFKKKIISEKNINFFINFYLFFLSPEFNFYDINNLLSNKKNFLFVFNLFKKKKINKNNLKEFIKSLDNKKTNKKFFLLDNKKINKKIFFHYLEKIWIEEKFNNSIEIKKIKNFFLGRMKKIFHNFSIKKIVENVDYFLNQKTKN